jgi:Domain of unknown function (DUF4150)
MSTPEAARKSEKFIAVCSEPNYCWTPAGKGKKIVPYMIACDLSESFNVSEDVFFTDEPAFLYSSSQAPRVKGNESGVGDGPNTSGIDERGNGGLNSDINNGVVWVEQHEETVLVNDIPVVRHMDKCWMNHKPMK